MECNKDEAFRAKAIAEKKLSERDFTASNKFALKAQRLYPKLDGLYQFLAIVDVYLGHEKKINGEPDYYRILGVDRLADEEALKKQYKKMALCLHPDENKSVEAGEAFKIMSQAWSVLSDKNKRNAYDLKMNVKASNPQSVPTQPQSTPGTTTNPQSKPTQNTATKHQSAPTRPHTPCTPTNNPHTRAHTPFTSTAKPKSVPTRPHTPCKATKPQTQTHTPVTATRSYAPCTATDPHNQRRNPVKSVPTPTQHTPGTTYTFNIKVNVVVGASNHSVTSFSVSTSNPQGKPTQNTATRPRSASNTPCTATKTQTPTHTPVASTSKPKSVPTRSHAPCTATYPQTRTHTPVTAAKRRSVPTPTQHTQGTATKRQYIPTQAQCNPGTAFKCKSVPTDQSQFTCTSTNPQTPGTTTSQPSKFVPCQLRNTKSRTSSANISGKSSTKTKSGEGSLKR